MLKSTELLFLFMLLGVADSDVDEKENGSNSGKWIVSYDGKDLVTPTNNTVEMKNSSDVYCYTLNKTDLALNKELKACESSVCTTWFNKGTLTSTCYDEEKFDFNCSQVQESCSNDDELDCCCNKSLCNSRNSTLPRPPTTNTATRRTTRAAESNLTAKGRSATTTEPQPVYASSTTEEETTRDDTWAFLPSVPLSLLILLAVVELALNVLLMKLLKHYCRRWRHERLLRKGCLFKREKMKKRIGQKEEILKEMASKTIGAKKVVEYYSKKLYDVKQLGRKRRVKRKAARDAVVNRYDEWERRLEKLVKKKGRNWPLSTASSFSSSPSSSPTSSEGQSESGTSESGQTSESRRRDELHEEILAAARSMQFYGDIWAGGRNAAALGEEDDADEQTNKANLDDDGMYEEVG